jgi:hypothetical protein
MLATGKIGFLAVRLLTGVWASSALADCQADAADISLLLPLRAALVDGSCWYYGPTHICIVSAGRAVVLHFGEDFREGDTFVFSVRMDTLSVSSGKTRASIYNFSDGPFSCRSALATPFRVLLHECTDGTDREWLRLSDSATQNLRDEVQLYAHD